MENGELKRFKRNSSLKFSIKPRNSIHIPILFYHSPILYFPAEIAKLLLVRKQMLKTIVFLVRYFQNQKNQLILQEQNPDNACQDLMKKI